MIRPISVVRSYQRLNFAKLESRPCDDLILTILQLIPKQQKNRAVAVHLLKWWSQHTSQHKSNQIIQRRWQIFAHKLQQVHICRFWAVLQSRFLKRYQLCSEIAESKRVQI